MIYVVLKATGTILNRCDAWELDGERRMRREAREAGWDIIGEEITFNGDMVLWVK